MKAKQLLLYLLLTAHCGLMTATVRYVSKTGSATPPYTSWTTASDSIQKCINICQAGDTVYVANGVYKENLVINTEIVLIGSSMDSTVIDGRGLANITIEIFEPILIENLKIFGKGNGIGAAAIYSAYQVNIRNCKISDAALGVGCLSNLIAYNIFITKLTGGISLNSSDTVCYTISNCIMNLSNEHSNGISIGFAENAIVYAINNIILFTGLINPRHGIYLSLPKKAYISNNFISRFLDNIMIDGFFDTAFIKNNVLAYHETSGATGSIYNSGGNIVANNVILSNNRIGLSTPSQWPWRVKSDYNIFWQNGIDIKGISYGDSDRVADPMFVKDTIPTSATNFDYHLQAYSPAIDRGDPNILDVDGTRSDIGMYGGPFGEITYYKDYAPKAPRNLSVIVDTNKVTIKWKRNTEADTSYYKVYRDTTQNFAIDSTKLIGTPADSFLVHPPLPHGSYYYKVSCVDKQGNESKPSEEIAVNITTMNDNPMTINYYFLYQNYPNPFNPSTTIGYKLKERGYVKLMVYDIKGELVSILVNQEQEAGYYEVEFSSKVGSLQSTISKVDNIASGIYLYRIEVIGEGNIPVYTEMRKMILIK